MEYLNMEKLLDQARAKGYTAADNLYEIRQWLWKDHGVYVSVVDKEAGNILGVSFRIRIPNAGDGWQTIEDDQMFVDLDTPIHLGVQKVLPLLPDVKQ